MIGITKVIVFILVDGKEGAGRQEEEEVPKTFFHVAHQLRIRFS